MRRLACVWVPHFAAAALLRAEPELRGRPVALMDGVAPTRTVVDVTDEAWDAGVRPGMAEAEAVARGPGLNVRAASGERDRATQEALLAMALGTSPRVEDGGAGIVYVDLDGLGALYGAEAAIGERLLRHSSRIGLPACVGIAMSRVAALSAARLGRRVTVVPAGEARAMLAPAPLELLDLAPELRDVFARWGVRSLGELAELPRAGLVTRLGSAGLAAQDLARGIDPAPFHPYTPPPFYQEAHGLEWEIVTLDQLAQVVGPLLERLTSRLDVAHVAADQLTLALGLAGGGRHDRIVDLAYPMSEALPMLALLRLDVEAHPPRAPVVHVALAARPVRVRAGQAGFWRVRAPAARELAVVLALLAALVGSARLGSPALVDSHRPDAFVLEPFHLGGGLCPPSEPPPEGLRRQSRRSNDPPTLPRRPVEWPGEDGRECEPRQDPLGTPARTLVLRRLRPAWPAEVDTCAERPVAVSAGSVAGRVIACAGPWRTSGEWWREEAWARDEWDVALSDRTLCRLVRDGLARRWFLDGVYD
jgi:protein ImuB